MKLILAEDACVLPDQSEIWSGSDEDVYGFKRKLVVPFSPRLQFEEGEPTSQWTNVAKILTGITWNTDIHLRMRNVEDGDIPAANVLHVVNHDDINEYDRLLQLIGRKNLSNFTGVLLTIQLGNSVSINFKGEWSEYADWDDLPTKNSANNYEHDVKLTEKQSLMLLITANKDIRVTHTASFQNLNAPEIYARILETGQFSDFEVVSNQGAVTRCHKVILIESSNKFKKEIEDGCRQLKLELSAHGVRAFLGYLYHGGLEEATENFLELALELLKAAGSYEVSKLWNDLVGILMKKDLDVEVAFAAFEILVKSGKVETTKDLARELVAGMHSKSATVSGDFGVFSEYFKDQAFFTAWFGLLPDVSTTKRGNRQGIEPDSTINNL